MDTPSWTETILKSHQVPELDTYVKGTRRKVVKGSTLAEDAEGRVRAVRILTLSKRKVGLLSKMDSDACKIAFIAIERYPAPGKTTVSSTLWSRSQDTSSTLIRFLQIVSEPLPPGICDSKSSCRGYLRWRNSTLARHSFQSIVS